MLNGFTRNVKLKLAVDQTFYETEVVGKKVCAFVGYKHAVGIKLQAFFVVFAVIIVRSFCGDIKKSLIRNRTLDVYMNILERVFVIVEIILIKSVIILFRKLVFVSLPKGNHRVQSFLFFVRFGFFSFFSLLFGEFFIFRNVRFDGVTDIIGIFLYKASYLVFFEIFAVFLVIGILL